MGDSEAAAVESVEDDVVDGPIPPVTDFAGRKLVRSLLSVRLSGTN